MARHSPITDPLRSALKRRLLPLSIIERETGVKRASIRAFVEGRQSLRLDIADKLAEFLGLRLEKHQVEEE